MKRTIFVTVLAAAVAATTLMAQDRLKLMPGFDNYSKMQPQLTGTVVPGTVSNAQFSPDGKSLTFTAAGKSMRLDFATMNAVEAAAAQPAGNGRPVEVQIRRRFGGRRFFRRTRVHAIDAREARGDPQRKISRPAVQVKEPRFRRKVREPVRDLLLQSLVLFVVDLAEAECSVTSVPRLANGAVRHHFELDLVLGKSELGAAMAHI